jgi:quinohemoprotein ethanol dehydrogenase
MAYDPKYNRIYIGTGNGAPWNQKIRSPQGGDNLFLCSIVALDADTGEYVWHYQVNPGESWDYNAAMDMALSEATIDGKTRDVLMTAPKNGFFYVIDRSNGKLISAGQIEYQNWAKGIDLKTGRPIEIPDARYPDGKPFMLFPSMVGAHGPEAMSFSPKSGLAYIPVRRAGGVYIDPPKPIEKWQWLGQGRPGSGTGAPPPGMVPPPTKSALLAWDPVRQRQAWRIPLQDATGGGGTMATAGGLVFQGRTEGRLVAMAAESGKELWSFDSQYAIGAQPISYSIGGKQYVSVIAGGRYLFGQGLKPEVDYRTQQWRVLTFALDGTDKLPPKTTRPAPFQDDPAFRVDPAKAGAGAMTFALRCANCHGINGYSGGIAPNLLRSPVPLDFAALKSVVHDGILLPNGMPKFAELTDAELEQIQHYIRQRAREELAKEAAPKH